MPIKEYITIKDILALFKKHWGLSITRPVVYYYIKRYNFPESTGRGCPRLWDKKKVDSFFAKNK